MSFFGDPAAEERPSIRLGRLHEGEVEIHMHTGDASQDWWYQGRPRIVETRVQTTDQLYLDLHDPLNAPCLNLIRKGWTDDQIAEAEFAWARKNVPGWTATKQSIDAAHARIGSLRNLAAHANDPHVVRIISLDRASKSEEQVMAFIDQDPLKEAPQKRYTETEKGWRHKQLVTLIGMGLLDVVFLWGMVSFASTPVATGTQSSQVSQQATSDLTYLLIAAGWVSSVIALYLWQARRTLVSTWELQPIKHLGLNTHATAVYLQNSVNEPASEYIARIVGLSAEAIRPYALAVANFQSSTISTLQEQNEAKDDDLVHVQLAAVGTDTDRINLRALGGRRAVPIVESGTSLWVVIGIVGVLVAVGVIAVILAMGG